MKPVFRSQICRLCRVTAPVLALAGLVSAATAFALSSPNPYQPIVERNVFALKPPTPVTTAAPEVAAPPPGLELRGVSLLFGRPQVLLNIKEPAKPPEPPKERSLVLYIGDREGDVQILDINVAAGSVRLRNQGKEIAMNLKDNAVKPTAAAAAPAVPGVPALPVPGVPTPRPAAPAAGAVPGVSPIGGSSAPAINAPATLPTRNIRGGAASPLSYQNNPDDARNLPLEAQHALIEIERERTREAVQAGRMPPLPPITPPAR